MNNSSKDFVSGWVLNNNATLTLSDYQKRSLATSYAKLAVHNELANADIQDKYQKARIYEMSLKQLGSNWVLSMAEISQEVYQWLALGPNARSLSLLMEIIGKEDRMIYVGLTLVLLSLFMYFMLLP